MALQIPQYLNGRSPEYLYNVVQATYLRAPQHGAGKYASVCSERPYDLKVCHGPERDGIRYGSFRSTNLTCQWFGMGCTSGHFYSKMVTVGQSLYELRVGQFAIGRQGGRYGVTVLNADDTQFISQSVDTWENVIGSPLVLGAALMSACVPVVEPFTRSFQIAPDSASLRRARAEVVSSTITTESGTRTYCKNSVVPQQPSRPLVIPHLANRWTGLYATVVAFLRPASPLMSTDEMASTE